MSTIRKEKEKKREREKGGEGADTNQHWVSARRWRVFISASRRDRTTRGHTFFGFAQVAVVGASSNGQKEDA